MKSLKQMRQELEELSKQQSELKNIIAKEEERLQKEKQFKKLIEGPGLKVSYQVFSKLINFISVMKTEGYQEAEELYTLFMLIGDGSSQNITQNFSQNSLPGKLTSTEDDERIIAEQSKKALESEEAYKEYIESLQSWLYGTPNGTSNGTQNDSCESGQKKNYTLNDFINAPAKYNKQPNIKQNVQPTNAELEDIAKLFEQVFGVDLKK